MTVWTKHRLVSAWYLAVTTEEYITFTVHRLQAVGADLGRLIPKSFYPAPVLSRVITRIRLKSRGHLDSLRQEKQLPVNGMGINPNLCPKTI
jgi:hypothetical protein